MESYEMTGRARILVVDDDEDILCFITEALNLKGYCVQIANNGVSAFEKLKDSKFDILLTDINMPRMNGLELLEKINSESIGVTPIIMSSMFSNKLKSDAQKKGALFCLDKPFSLGSLFSAIKNSFEQRALN